MPVVPCQFNITNHEHLDVNEALLREKRIKKWIRQWKINLIQRDNLEWLDLSVGLC